ncbi:MAG: 4-hydroxybenzoate 3-monooxygenase [Gemmatimonadales bacterium]
MTRRVTTRVGIVGGGPAGLMLSHLLAREGVDSIVLEARSRDYVIKRVRAGVLEQGTVDLLTESGVGDRLAELGLVHTGFEIRFDGTSVRIALDELTGGRAITIYGQQEVVRDLIDARLAAGGALHFEIDDVRVEDPAGRPSLRATIAGEPTRIECDLIAGCDGFHGICRDTIPASERTVYEREFPYGWVGILVAAPPSSDELIYAHHPRGFALHSMRSPEITRLYVQCPHDDEIEAWPDQRIWEELHARLAAPGWSLTEGPILEKGVTGMRSFVIEPMQHGNLFLAGDAAHIVPPTGAKGLNLAMADVRRLAEGMIDFFRTGSRRGLDGYTADCLRRVWRAQEFSSWMTGLLHTGTAEPFARSLQLARLRQLATSPHARALLAENYVGPVAV